MSRNHTEATITYTVYLDGYELIGTVTAELPNVQNLTTEIKGAGIAGTINSPIQGMYEPMSMKLNFRTITPSLSKLTSGQTEHIELWAAIQTMDPATGKYGVSQHKIITRATLKSNTSGKLESASAQDKSLEFEVIYMKETLGGNLVQEIDKYNMIANTNGFDVLAAVKSAIGRD